MDILVPMFWMEARWRATLCRGILTFHNNLHSIRTYMFWCRLLYVQQREPLFVTLPVIIFPSLPYVLPVCMNLRSYSFKMYIPCPRLGVEWIGQPWDPPNPLHSEPRTGYSAGSVRISHSWKGGFLGCLTGFFDITFNNRFCATKAVWALGLAPTFHAA